MFKNSLFCPLLHDPLSLFFAGIILLVSLPSALHSVGYLKGECSPRKTIMARVLLALFVVSMIWVVSAGNALGFLVAWEAMSLLSYFLVIFDTENEKSAKAGMIYIVMTHIGTAFITAAFLMLYRHAGSFDFGVLREASLLIPSGEKNVIFLLFFAGFGTKAGIVPLHVWLPYAHPQAPSPVSAVMSGVMIKTAVYGLIRFVIGILGVDAWWWGNLVMVLGSASCLVGVVYALMERDIKRLLAYSSVENMGIILLGLGASMMLLKNAAPGLSVLALSAALYHTLNHAVFKSLLFLSAGNVYKATGTRNMEKYGGLIKTMPWTAGAFLVGSLAISGIPPLNGFVSEWLTFQSLFSGALTAPGTSKIIMAVYAAVLALTGGLAAACFVKAFGISFLAMPRSASAAKATEMPRTMLVSTGFLALVALALGLAAAPVMKIIMTIAGHALSIETAEMPVTLNLLTISTPFTNGNFLSVPVIALLLVIVALVSAAGMRWFFGKRVVSIGPTWGCGYYTLDSRNEYTGTAFSKPFRIVFSFFLKPYHQTKQVKESYYYMKSMRYEVHTTPVIKNYMYGSALRFVMSSARLLRRLQTGSVHLYIAYIFATIVFLILFL